MPYFEKKVPKNVRPATRNYLASMHGRRIGSIASGASKILVSGINKLSKGMYTRPKKKKSAGDFSSEYLPEEDSYMRASKVKSRISGMRGSKEDKILASLRAERLMIDPRRYDDPHISRKEAEQASRKTRALFGDAVADDFDREIKKAFAGKHTISLKRAKQYVKPIARTRGKQVGTAAELILENYDPKFQKGRAARYFTQDKLESLIQETEKTDKYAAHSLRQQFRVTNGQQKFGRGVTFANSARRNKEAMSTSLAKKELGLTGGSSADNSKSTTDAARGTGAIRGSASGSTMSMPGAAHLPSRDSRLKSSPSASPPDLGE